MASRASIDAPNPDDVALFAYTSGTTGRPKCVPLTHANVLWSSRNIAAHYDLNLGRPQPGGIAAVPRPRFDRRHIVDLGVRGFCNRTIALFSLRVLETVPRASRDLVFRGAYYSSGAPGAGQTATARLTAAHDSSARVRLPLAPTILTKLENRFGAPVLEAYGMTEAAHQVASNPLPPLPHKPGTVGHRRLEFQSLMRTGRHLAANTPGEVVVRGPNVMRGYRNDPEANAIAFTRWMVSHGRHRCN